MTTRTCTLAIDVGGTFTDITFTDAATGALWVAKTPSTPGDLSTGFITAVRKVLALAGRAPADVLRVFHGTTTATNAILEGKTPPTALVTTAGFKYVLEIGRHDIPRHGNLYGWSKPTRPITPERVFEVDERLDVDGSVLRPLDEPGARALARQLAQMGVPAVAVVFLHAYANPAHEQRMQAILAEEYPGVLVSLSSEVLPQFREFERTMATALNAAVMPPVSRYVSVLRQALDARGPAGAAAHHEVGRRRHQRGHLRAPAGADRAVGPRRGRRRRGVGRALGRLRRHHLDRRRRHQRRHLPGARRAARGHQGRHDRAVPAQAAHRGHPHDRRGRREHRRGDQRGPSHGGAAQRGRRARARLLSPRRERADRDRRASGAGPHPGRPARRRAAARRAGGARGHHGAHRPPA